MIVTFTTEVSGEPGPGQEEPTDRSCAPLVAGTSEAVGTLELGEHRPTGVAGSLARPGCDAGFDPL